MGEKMKRFTILIVAMTLFQLSFGCYMYGKGEMDGAIHYKRSKNFMLTLHSMYHMGWMDGFDAAERGKK